MLEKIKCVFSIHKLKLIARKNNYTLDLLNENVPQGTEHFILRFYVCERCNKRYVKVIGDSYFAKKTNALQDDIKTWKDTGILPNRSTIFNKAYMKKQLELLEEHYVEDK